MVKTYWKTQGYSYGQEDTTIGQQLQAYFLAFLRGELPNSPADSSVLGEVGWAKSKTASPDTWHLTYGGSVLPNSERFAEYINDEATTINMEYAVTGTQLCRTSYSLASRKHR